MTICAMAARNLVSPLTDPYDQFRSSPPQFKGHPMPNEEQNQDVQWMSPASKSLPTPQHTGEFPSGLINDYIKLVDRMRNLPPKDK